MADRNSHDAAKTVDPGLTDREWFLLDRGLAEWGGPAECTDALARVMGFEDGQDLVHGDGRRLHQAVRDHAPLSRVDWVRALLATEIAFASDVVGSGADWPTTTGLSDEESLAALRSVQAKIQRIRSDLG